MGKKSFSELHDLLQVLLLFALLLEQGRDFAPLEPSAGTFPSRLSWSVNVDLDPNNNIQVLQQLECVGIDQVSHCLVIHPTIHVDNFWVLVLSLRLLTL